jgi:hypothetical protein
LRFLFDTVRPRDAPLLKRRRVISSLDAAYPSTPQMPQSRERKLVRQARSSTAFSSFAPGAKVRPVSSHAINFEIASLGASDRQTFLTSESSLKLLVQELAVAVSPPPSGSSTLFFAVHLRYMSSFVLATLKDRMSIAFRLLLKFMNAELGIKSPNLDLVDHCRPRQLHLPSPFFVARHADSWGERIRE